MEAEGPPPNDKSWDDDLRAARRARSSPSPEAQQALRDSCTEEIVEDSPTDYFWGAGADGSGQNMFGKLWMKIRAGEAG